MTSTAATPSSAEAHNHLSFGSALPSSAETAATIGSDRMATHGPAHAGQRRTNGAKKALPVDRQELAAAFRFFDTDGKGYLTKDDLESKLHLFYKHVKPVELQYLMNKKQKISYQGTNYRAVLTFVGAAVLVCLHVCVCVHIIPDPASLCLSCWPDWLLRTVLCRFIRSTSSQRAVRCGPRGRGLSGLHETGRACSQAQ